ncbi:MAG: hypothetical protein P4L50_10250, partial [Anaerolineaceae bacterium]|nr:hypothetical protein [Anaerolineaceae bacterium]
PKTPKPQNPKTPHDTEIKSPRNACPQPVYTQIHLNIFLNCAPLSKFSGGQHRLAHIELRFCDAVGKHIEGAPTYMLQSLKRLGRVLLPPAERLQSSARRFVVNAQTDRRLDTLDPLSHAHDLVPVVLVAFHKHLDLPRRKRIDHDPQESEVYSRVFVPLIPRDQVCHPISLYGTLHRL